MRPPAPGSHRGLIEEVGSRSTWRKIRKHYAIVDKRVVHLFHPERGFPFREWPRGIRIEYGPRHKRMLMSVGPKRMLMLQVGILWNWWTTW